MNDFETQVGRLLFERAAGVDVHPDEDAVRAGLIGVAQFDVARFDVAQTGPSRRRGRSSWLVAAAASLAVTGVAVWLMQRTTTNPAVGEAMTGVELAADLPALLGSVDQPSTGIVIVWMDPAADAGSIAAVHAALAHSRLVDGLEYVDHQETYAEFKAYFADEPEVWTSVAPEDLPTSFRAETDLPELVGADVRLLPGVVSVDGTSYEADDE